MCNAIDVHASIIGTHARIIGTHARITGKHASIIDPVFDQISVCAVPDRRPSLKRDQGKRGGSTVLSWFELLLRVSIFNNE